MIKGFKCFDSGLINRYGKKFQLNKEYRMSNISFGLKSTGGFHFCTKLEDTFRYYDAMHGMVDICEVTASGLIIKGPDDEYYGYYDSYVASKIVLDKLLTYEEIIKYADSLDDIRFKRFVSLFHLNESDLAYFRNKYASNINIMATIDHFYKQR